ncbi:hypothetical protein ACFLYZ_02130 [Thermodesulfobacteriota bacterium]
MIQDTGCWILDAQASPPRLRRAGGLQVEAEHKYGKQNILKLCALCVLA